MTGRHTKVTLSFLVVGHTKFSPDWCFGLFKRLFRRTKVGSLQTIAQVVNNSACCNYSQLVVTEDGLTVVPIFDWTSFFAPHMKKIPGIKKLRHFRFPSSEPGVVYTKVNADDEDEKRSKLLKDSWVPDANEYPPRVSPKGLSTERQWYLYDQIREFCPEEDRDVTCPEPEVPRPRSRAGTPANNSDNSEVGSPPPPPTKKIRHCGTCGREGHNRRACPNKEN